MADDRHEAYRSIHTMSELTSLFKLLKNKHDVEDVVYRLMTLQKDNPRKSVTTIIDMVKDELYGE